MILHLPLSGDDHLAAVDDFEDRLDEALPSVDAEFDGNEIGEGQAVLYAYGRDTDQMLDVIRSCFGSLLILPGSYATKRYGPSEDADALEVRVDL